MPQALRAAKAQVLQNHWRGYVARKLAWEVWASFPSLCVCVCVCLLTRSVSATVCFMCVCVFARRVAPPQNRERLDKAREAAAAAAEEEARKAEESHAAEVHRRMHPRSGTDFQILYNELEAWRAAETHRINSEGLSERDRLEALAQLLHKETKLLQTIDRLKLTATRENRERRIGDMLELMAAPKVWEASNGASTAVHTPFTTRAKELSDLYQGVCLPPV